MAIEGDDLASMALHYFETSEQLRCAVHLACEKQPTGWRAAALILERVAGEGGIQFDPDGQPPDDAWQTATALAATVRSAELLDDHLTPEDLLFRLFGNEGVVADQARALAYGCRCSRQKLSGILEGFSADDLDHMSEGGAITMNCEFCNLGFRFARDEVRGVTEGAAE